MKKIINYFNSSLSRKVFSLMGICFLFFIVGAAGYYFIFSIKFRMNIFNSASILKEKQQIIHYIYNQFNTDILVMTDSVAIKVPENRELALNQENELKNKLPNSIH